MRNLLRTLEALNESTSADAPRRIAAYVQQNGRVWWADLAKALKVDAGDIMAAIDAGLVVVPQGARVKDMWRNGTGWLMPAKQAAKPKAGAAQGEAVCGPGEHMTFGQCRPVKGKGR